MGATKLLPSLHCDADVYDCTLALCLVWLSTSHILLLVWDCSLREHTGTVLAHDDIIDDRQNDLWSTQCSVTGYRTNVCYYQWLASSRMISCCCLRVGVYATLDYSEVYCHSLIVWLFDHINVMLFRNAYLGVISLKSLEQFSRIYILFWPTWHNC